MHDVGPAIAHQAAQRARGGEMVRGLLRRHSTGTSSTEAGTRSRRSGAVSGRTA